jgi:hypothetical protein
LVTETCPLQSGFAAKKHHHKPEMLFSKGCVGGGNTLSSQLGGRVEHLPLHSVHRCHNLSVYLCPPTEKIKTTAFIA